MDWWKNASFLSGERRPDALDTEQITATTRLLEAERAEYRLESELQRKQMEVLDARLERLERAIETLAAYTSERGRPTQS